MKTKYAALLLPVALVIPSLPLLARADAPQPTPTPTPVHCQVPCGIYGDLMRIDMLMEDAATIEKGMAQVREMEAAEKPNYNQIVRWITTKDEHAQHVQDMAGDYWFAQRIKAPAPGAEEVVRTTYDARLRHMHGVMVSAMKCKQTTDAANVEALRRHARAFSALYFSAEDLKHIEEHHAKEKK